MNFEPPNLLSSYSPGEADWGIDDLTLSRRRYNSISTSEYSQPKTRDFARPTPHFYGRSGSLGVPSLEADQRSALSDFHGLSGASTAPSLRPTTENFRLFTQKYLLLAGAAALVVEKFKYNLILSNLLDDTLILSKNEQALANLTKIRRSEHHLHPLRRTFDGVVLTVVGKRYTVHFPALPLALLLSIVSLTIFLLKQQHSRLGFPHLSRLKLFKLLVIAATRVVKCRRLRATVEASRGLRRLDDFMIANCVINKVVIANMITLKEYEMFASLDKGNPLAVSRLPEYCRSLKSHLHMLLSCLLLNAKHSIMELLPYSNGELLEKYCAINNVPLGSLFDSGEDAEILLETLTAKLALFNDFRRFFICQLLAIHDSPHYTFLISKLCDNFGVSLPPTPPFVPMDAKMEKLKAVFEDHTAILKQLEALNQKFRQIHNPHQTTDFANDNILSTKLPAAARTEDMFGLDSDLNLNHLIDKLQNLSASLKYFKKYSLSIKDVQDAQEHDERLGIFALFSDELKAAMDLFSVCSSSYQSDYTAKFDSGSARGSQKGSQAAESFNLKSFHTIREKSERRRTAVVSDKRSKRLSSGIQLGLVTVLEDGQNPKAERTSADGECFNQAALDALTRKIGFGPSNRFSVNSLNSNISGITDLIASTQITTDEDDERSPYTGAKYIDGAAVRGMAQDELKSRLEERMTRAYDVSRQTPTEEAPELPTPDLELATSAASKNLAFLGSLEETLARSAPL